MTEKPIPAAWIKAHPWRHLLAWMFRRNVYSHDSVPRHWYEGEQRDRAFHKERYEELRDYLEDVAQKHYPVVHNAERMDVSVFDPTIELKCSCCPYMWPCPTWKVATRRDYEPVRVHMKQREAKEAS